MPAVKEATIALVPQQSIAAILATVTHHSFDKVGTASGLLRNRKTATRTGKGEEYETHYTAEFRKTPLPQAAATVNYPMTDDEGGELSAGVRPAPLEEGRPQGKLELNAGIGYEIFQNFDVPMPQMVKQFAEPRAVLCRTLNCFRAGYRSAGDLASRCSSATFVSRHAAGGTAGGSADDSLLPQAADSRADRRQSSSVWWSWLTFQLRAVVSGVFKVLSQNRVHQRLLLLLWNAFPSGLWSRSLFLGLVKAFKIFSQDRVHPLLLTIQLVVLKLWMSLGTVFFRTFPLGATQPPHSGSALLPHSSPWTPAAYDASMVLEEEEEESEDEPVEYVQHDGRWWGCKWVPAHQRYCWWLAAADGSHVGHAICRPPWLIGSGPW